MRLKLVFFRALVFIICLLPLTISAQLGDYELIWDIDTHISYTVQFSHNSQWILSFGDSEALRIFNATNGELVNSSIPSTVQYPFFSKDDSHIYGKSYKDIAYYNTSSWEYENHFEQSDKEINMITITDDEKYLIGVTKGITAGGIIIWDVVTGKIIREKTIVKDPQAATIDFTHVRVSKDNKKIYIRSYETFIINPRKPESVSFSRIKAYDFGTLDSLAMLTSEWDTELNGNVIRYFEFSHDCSMIAIAYADKNVGLKIFRLSDMGLIRELNINGYNLTGFQFTNDDKYLVYAGNGSGSYGVNYYNIETGNVDRKGMGGIDAFDLSNDEINIVVSGDKDIVLLKNKITPVEENPTEKTELYPNPTTGDIFITIPDIILNEIKILGINGELKANINPLEVRVNPHTLKLNLNEYANGTYFIDIYGDNWHETYKAALVK